MNYFYLKLGEKNCEADERLGNPRPTASVYFDNCSERDYEAGRGKSQARLFWECGQAKNRKETVMVVIKQGRIWLLQPTGGVTFSKPWSHPGGFQLTTKTMPVEILWSGFCKDVPPVLAGMGSSQHHGRRTFTQSQHWGNIKAIDYVLGRATDARLPASDEWNLKKQGAAQLLECLGSTELETLVGKLFEARGCHVPAYLGGTLKDIDIFAYNDTNQMLRIGQIAIPKRSRISIQVKTWKPISCPLGVDYLIGLDAVCGKQTFDAEWLLDRVRETAPVAEWMKRSLAWLPRPFLKHFQM